jgi:hypothetical protein
MRMERYGAIKYTSVPNTCHLNTDYLHISTRDIAGAVCANSERVVPSCTAIYKHTSDVKIRRLPWQRPMW